MFFWDYTYFLIIPPLLLALYAQAIVRGTYAKYSKLGASSGISGAQMAKEILNLRDGIYPVASFGSTLAFPIFLVGFFMSQKGPSILMDIGILLFAGAVLFSVLTLPVEFDASKRAMALLGERGYLRGQELDGARRVLSAGALAYFASTAMAAMQLLRMFLIRQSRD